MGELNVGGQTCESMPLAGVRETLGSCLWSGTTGELHIIAVTHGERTSVTQLYSAISRV